MTDYKFAHDGELDDALEIACSLRGPFDVYHEGLAWIDADRGVDRCGLEGTFTAAELRSIADFMDPPGGDT